MQRTLIGTALIALLAATPALAQSRPPAQMAIENRRAATLSELVIADDQGNVVGRIAKPIASGKKGAVKLQRAKGCEFLVQAKFDDEGEVEETLNFCKEKVLRFVE